MCVVCVCVCVIYPSNCPCMWIDLFYRFIGRSRYGYDAVLQSNLPAPPQQPPATPSDSATWHWDGMPASGNGDNAVWVGSTTAGLRLLVKGDDPLWQAGVPFDSRATPEPPTSWSVAPHTICPAFF